VENKSSQERRIEAQRYCIATLTLFFKLQFLAGMMMFSNGVASYQLDCQETMIG
jgi:hypothetical protein